MMLIKEIYEHKFWVAYMKSFAKKQATKLSMVKKPRI